MDAFWVLPLAIVVIAFCVSFGVYLMRRPSSPCTPHVVVHKPDEPAVDKATQDSDWSSRPSGSFLDWLSGRDKKK